jgi:hypothetical protein
MGSVSVYLHFVDQTEAAFELPQRRSQDRSGQGRLLDRIASCHA